jgi:hypothetical protein
MWISIGSTLPRKAEMTKENSRLDLHHVINFLGIRKLNNLMLRNFKVLVSNLYFPEISK